MHIYGHPIQTVAISMLNGAVFEKCPNYFICISKHRRLKYECLKWWLIYKYISQLRLFLNKN